MAPEFTENRIALQLLSERCVSRWVLSVVFFSTRKITDIAGNVSRKVKKELRIKFLFGLGVCVHDCNEV